MTSTAQALPAQANNTKVPLAWVYLIGVRVLIVVVGIERVHICSSLPHANEVQRGQVGRGQQRRCGLIRGGHPAGRVRIAAAACIVGPATIGSWDVCSAELMVSFVISSRQHQLGLTILRFLRQSHGYGLLHRVVFQDLPCHRGWLRDSLDPVVTVRQPVGV